MSHLRQQIRARVATILDTGSFATRVFQQRAYPAETFPCALVYATAEEIVRESLTLQGGGGYVRLLKLQVELIARAGTTAADDLDTLCVEAEHAMAADPTLGGLCEIASLEAVEITLSQGAGTVAVARLTYIIEYRTSATDVETA